MAILFGLLRSIALLFREREQCVPLVFMIFMGIVTASELLCALSVTAEQRPFKRRIIKGAVAQGMSSSLLVQSFLVHGACSFASCAVSGSRWLEGRAPWLTTESKATALVSTSILGTAMATGALHPTNSARGSGGSSVLLLLGTACFGISDFATQALLRAAMGEMFEGSPLLEASCSNVLFTLTLGNIVMFSAGPFTPPWWQAAFVFALGLGSCACLGLSTRRKRTVLSGGKDKGDDAGAAAGGIQIQMTAPPAVAVVAAESAL